MFSLPIVNPFIQLGLKKSYFMPNILGKKKKHQFWVKKNLGYFLGDKMQKIAFLSIFENFDPQKHPPKFF